MSSRRLWRHLLVLTLAAVIAVALAAGASPDRTAASSPACALGARVAQRVILRPRAGTFYSVDALAPDVVPFRGQWLLFFSGNDVSTDAGTWYTGLATAPAITGPWRVAPNIKLPWLDGGSAVYRGRLYTLATAHDGEQQPVLYASRDARHWRVVSRVPLPPPGKLRFGQPGSWRSWMSDMSLYAEPWGLDAYYAARPGPSGADIGSAVWRGGRWGDFRVALRRNPGAWDGLDLGGPAVFQAGGRRYMLYAGLSASGAPRQIGAAVRTPRGWQRCAARPLIATGTSFYSRNAIDPSAAVVGRMLFVFFGGGETSSLGGNMRGTIAVRVYRLPG